MNKQKRKNDIFLIAFLLVLCIAIWGILRITKESGADAEITVDGITFALLPLERDTELEVTDSRGGINIVKVEDGKVQVIEANCPDRICVRQGKISYEGESIVCLPHKMIVTVRGGEKGIDAFAN